MANPGDCFMFQDLEDINVLMIRDSEGKAHAFCHLIHGVQRAGSEASKAVSALKKRGIQAHDKQPAKAAFA